MERAKMERLQPQVIWAQRAEKVYLTINVEDCKSPEIKFDGNKVHFSGKCGPEKKQYECTIELFEDLNPEECKYKVTDRRIPLTLVKKESAYWPRLLKDKKKSHWLKTDFEMWKDEDDSDVDESKDMAFEDMMKQMGGMGGMGGGMGGMPPGMGGMGGMPPGMGGMGGMPPGMGGMGGMPPGMAGMGGLGDMGDMELPGEDADSDDEALPDLE